MLPRSITILAFLLLAAVSVGAERLCFERPLIGTRFRIICYADQPALATKAVEAAFQVAAGIEATASDYLPESELSRLATKPVGTPIPLSQALYALLEHSRRLAEATGGASDPTLGPLTKLWRASHSEGHLPEPEKLRVAGAAVGWRHYTLDPGARTLTLHREQMGFDLGGVAKGYAADRMLESLAAAGITRVLVAAGGDIRLGDPPPGRDGWRVALQTFDPSRPDETRILANAAVSTSGDLHQWVEIEGMHYSHILDPTSGLGFTRRIAASVIAEHGTLSDPLATAACVLGPEAGAALRLLPGVREVKIRVL